MTFPNSFIYLMATGDFQGFLAKTDDTNIYKLSKVRTLPSTNLYKSEKINTLINLPLYEIKVEYNIIISRNPINILFSFLIAIVCPFISFISFKWTSKYNWVDRKIHYGGSFISSLVIFWSIWTYLFKNDSIELLFYHKALWAIVILFSILYCVPIIKNIFKKTMLKLSKIFCIIHNRWLSPNKSLRKWILETLMNYYFAPNHAYVKNKRVRVPPWSCMPTMRMFVNC